MQCPISDDYYYVMLYSPYLGSNGMDLAVTLSRAAVYAEVQAELHPDRKMDSTLPFIPEEAYYQCIIIVLST